MAAGFVSSKIVFTNTDPVVNNSNEGKGFLMYRQDKLAGPFSGIPSIPITPAILCGYFGEYLVYTI